MASIREYFDTDFPYCVRANGEFEFQEGFNSIPTTACKCTYKFVMDFVTRAKCIAIFVESPPRAIESIYELIKFSQNEINTSRPPKNLQLPNGSPAMVFQVKNLPDHVEVKSGYQTDGTTDFEELVSTNRIFVYLGFRLSKETLDQISVFAKGVNLSVVIRDPSYAESRSQFETPKAFISHDSRDKDLIVRPMVAKFQSWMCPVWYDEYSLKPGDSLRESIEKGIRTCKKCIVVLTKNFITNPGWVKTEFNSIFTKEIMERSNSILPVWCDVTKEELYEYSPILVDKVGTQWSLGVEEVCRRLHKVIKD